MEKDDRVPAKKAKNVQKIKVAAEIIHVKTARRCQRKRKGDQMNVPSFTFLKEKSF